MINHINKIIKELNFKRSPLEARAEAHRIVNFFKDQLREGDEEGQFAYMGKYLSINDYWEERPEYYVGFGRTAAGSPESGSIIGVWDSYELFIHIFQKHNTCAEVSE